MRRLHWWGWVFFLASSVLYLALGLRDGDWLMTAGSAAFLVGVLALMGPDRSLSNRKSDHEDRQEL